jgi:hypothetical protein
VLDLPGAGKVLSATSENDVQTLQFVGPRVRIGLYKGECNGMLLLAA